MSFESRTFQQLTAPGYFDFSAQQTAKTAAMAAWFDGVMAYPQAQLNLFDETFRLWMTRDYSAITPSRKLYLYHLSQSVGFTWLKSDLNVERDILSYLLAPKRASISDSLGQLVNLLSDIDWISGSGSIVPGQVTPILFAETLLIYSNAGSPPPTPSNTTYARRAWDAPTGWTLAPDSSTYLCRGYIDSGEIVWLTPVSTASNFTYYDSADIGGMPGAANNGDVCGVLDDGSGDSGAIYTWDTSAWFKCSTIYSLQGEVLVDSYFNSSGVFAPDDPTITSQTQPPADGPSKGYGFYGQYGSDPSIVLVRIWLTLTDAGNENVGTIINLFRRIKPMTVGVVLYLTYMDITSIVQIKDLRSIN